MSINVNEAEVLNNSNINIKSVSNKKIIYRIVKRIIDIIGAIVGIVLLIPITICVWIARKILKEDERTSIL